VQSRGVTIAALAGLAASSLLCAATIDELDVTRDKDRYTLVANAHLEATPQSIYDVLMEYDDNAYGRISSAYKESKYLEPDADGTPVVYTRMEGCLLWHCTMFERVERLESREPSWIKSYTVPERSNFKYSTSEWRLEADGHGGTNMVYELVMEPDFWVPPLVGPLYLKRKLSSGGERAVRRIERLARQLEGLPVDATVPLPGSSSR
jgi:polyketide cyclase/dehydrase/lipid transport protein